MQQPLPLPLLLDFFLWCPPDRCSHCTHAPCADARTQSQHSAGLAQSSDGNVEGTRYHLIQHEQRTRHPASAVHCLKYLRRLAHKALHAKPLIRHILDVYHRLLRADVACHGLGHKVHAYDVRPTAIVCALNRSPWHRAQHALGHLRRVGDSSRARLMFSWLLRQRTRPCIED